LAALMVGYAGIFAAFYPPVAGVEDEVGFLNQALVWSRGAVSSEGAGLPCGLPDFMDVDGRHVPTRHPGRSLVALPFLALGGVRATFASGLLLHLGATAAAAALLARLGRSPLWAALVLFHPTLALFSRTVMADGPAGGALLLAALAVASGAPVAAGLAVGLAAALRYHSALALPLVAGSFVVPRGADPPSDGWRRAAVCLASGAAAGALLVVYNLAVYHAPNEPFTARRGYFSAAFLAPHALFYATALMLIWPGMLLAPLLDRSRLRWLVRGAVVVFLGPLLFYYFHDRGAGLIETALVGQRLLQVALPLWVVSYAGVVDDRVAAPARARLGPRLWTWSVAIGCVGLLAGTALMFAKHQRHLDGLKRVRDDLVRNVPAGALIATSGPVYKVVGTPVGVPPYRFRPVEMSGKPIDPPGVLDDALRRERRPWFLAALRRAPGDPLPDIVPELARRHRLEPVPVGSPLLGLYAARPGEGASP
jgi:hypothetical protein